MGDGTEITLGGQIAMAMAQVVVLFINGLLYARQKSALDIEKRDRGLFDIDVKYAKHLAIEVRDAVAALRTKNYEELKETCESLLRANAKLRADIMSLDESVKTLQNKLASRDRADRRAAMKAAPEPEDEPDRADDAPSDLAELARRGIAVPLFAGPQNDTPPQAPPASSFGRAAKKG